MKPERFHVHTDRGFTTITLHGDEHTLAVIHDRGHWIILNGVSRRSFPACQCDDPVCPQWWSNCWTVEPDHNGHCHGWHLPRLIHTAAIILTA